MKHKFIIFGAGQGIRLNMGLPKILVPLGDKLLCQYQIETIRAVCPKAEILYVIGYKADLAREVLAPYNVDIIENTIYDTVGGDINYTAGISTFVLCRGYDKPKMIVRIDGDMLFSKQFVKDCMKPRKVTVIAYPSLCEVYPIKDYAGKVYPIAYSITGGCYYDTLAELFRLVKPRIRISHHYVEIDSQVDLERALKFAATI